MAAARGRRRQLGPLRHLGDEPRVHDRHVELAVGVRPADGGGSIVDDLAVLLVDAVIVDGIVLHDELLGARLVLSLVAMVEERLRDLVRGGVGQLRVVVVGRRRRQLILQRVATCRTRSALVAVRGARLCNGRVHDLWCEHCESACIA